MIVIEKWTSTRMGWTMKKKSLFKIHSGLVLFSITTCSTFVHLLLNSIIWETSWVKCDLASGKNCHKWLSELLCAASLERTDWQWTQTWSKTLSCSILVASHERTIPGGCGPDPRWQGRRCPLAESESTTTTTTPAAADNLGRRSGSVQPRLSVSAHAGRMEVERRTDKFDYSERNDAKSVSGRLENAPFSTWQQRRDTPASLNYHQSSTFLISVY